MKFFIDSANIGEIREALSLGMCDGVTTNPSLVAKEKRPFDDVVREILAAVPGPVSLEVVSLDAAGMAAEARKLVELGGNVVIKVPMTTEGLKATKILSGEGIDVNQTLVFSPVQALMAAKAGAAYVSPFVGRLTTWPRTGWNSSSRSWASTTTTGLRPRSSWPACVTPCTS